MSNCLKYPLIGLEEECDLQTAQNFIEKMKNEVSKIKNDTVLDVDQYFVLLKTKYDKSFGVIVSKENRFHLKNILHKTGYKSKRVSYSESVFEDPIFEQTFPQLKKSKMVPKEYTSFKAYTLSKDGELVKIGEVYFSEDKKSEFYLDGLRIKGNPDPKKSYRNKGVAKALLDYVHNSLAEKQVQFVCADTIKIDKSGYYFGEYQIVKNPESASFKMLKNLGYKIESMKYYQDPFIGITPMRAKLKDIIENNYSPSKSTEITLHEFYEIKSEEKALLNK